MTDHTATVAPVVREAIVGAPAETCFKTFVDGFATWWPPEHHIGDRDVVDFCIEPRVGGRCYDVDTDGGENHWGTVLAHEPPTRFVFAWHIQGDWSIDHDANRQSVVEVTFTSLDDERTMVRLEHRNLERHGGGAAGVRAGIDSPAGWSATVKRFADVAEGRSPRPLPRIDRNGSPALQTALEYYAAWTANDLDRAFVHVAEDIVCDAPAGRIEGKAAYRAFLEPFAGMLLDASLIAGYGDDDTAMIMYDTKTRLVESGPGAELIHIADGKISYSRFIFDRVPFEAARAKAAPR